MNYTGVLKKYAHSRRPIITFTLTKLLSLLIYPLTQTLLLGLLGLLLMYLGRSRASLAIVSLAIGWLSLCSSAAFAGFLMGLLERDYPPRALSTVGEADVIVLLGGAMRGDALVGSLPDMNQQADRLVYAAALYQARKAPLLLLTGGGPPEDRTEAEQMRDILAVMGVPADAMLLETESRDTHDNAVYSARILRDRGLRRVLLVTSSWHMRRAQALFRKQGIEVEPAPTDFQRLVGHSVLPGVLPGAGNLVRTTHALHEMVGYQVYRWRGWL